MSAQLSTLGQLSSPDAEFALLGSIIFAPEEVMSHVADWIEPDDFTELANIWVYNALLSLHNRDEGIDNLTVTEELRRMHKLEQMPLGGSAYVTRLLNETPTHVNWYGYASVIKSASKRRRTVKTAGDIAEAALRGSRDAVLRSIESLKRIMEESTPDSNPFMQYLIPARELKNLNPVTWLIPGEIPEQGLVSVYGPSGVGKSFFVLDIALRLAQSKRVLYVASEGELGFRSRVQAWCTHHKQTEGDLYFFLNVVALLDPKEKKLFEEVVKANSPKVIIIDTLAHCMLPGNENDTRDMGLFVKAAKGIMKQFNCAVILVHHTAKNQDYERGSVALRAACDVMIKLSDEENFVISVECTKSKDARAFETRYITLLPVQLDATESAPIVIPAKNVKQTLNDPLTPNQIKVLEAFNLEVFRQAGATLNDVAENTRLGRGVVQRLVSRLAELAYLDRDDVKSPYTITPAGKKYLERLSQSSANPSPSSESAPGGLTQVTHPDSPTDSGRSPAPRPLTQANHTPSRAFSANLTPPESGESDESAPHPRVDASTPGGLTQATQESESERETRTAWEQLRRQPPGELYG